VPKLVARNSCVAPTRQTRAIVVGAGAAGCVVAASFVRSGFAVTVIESGPDRNPLDSTQPVNSSDLFTAASDTSHVADVASNTGPYRRGTGLGGSGAINGLLLHPATPEDYDRWAALAGCEGWDSANLWPIITRRLGRGRTHQFRGPVDTLLSQNIPTKPAPFAVDAHGLRACSAATDLEPLRNRLTMRTRAHVARVLLESGRATGVELTDGEIVPADLVVVCAGVVQSPILLWRSGLDRPGIGANLHDHPSIGVSLQLDEATPPHAPVTTVTGHVASARAGMPPLQVLPLNRTGLHGVAVTVGALQVGVLEQYGRGHLTLDPDGTARLIFSVGHDQDLVGLRHAARILHTAVSNPPPGTTVVDAPPPPDVSTDEVDAWISDHPGNYLHAAGTCRMGSPTDEFAVVDNNCQVIGTPSLYVLDASIFPNQPRANPYLPTMAVAELGASRIAGIVSAAS
jgi:choline dehydrogenase-like flavoprotein